MCQHCTEDDWKQILFANESHFNQKCVCMKRREDEKAVYQTRTCIASTPDDVALQHDMLYSVVGIFVEKASYH